MVLLMLGFLLLSACTSKTGTSELSCPPIPEPPTDFCQEGQTVQYTKDEQGCFTQMQCGVALPFETAELNDCVSRCDETEPPEGDDAFVLNSYNYCKSACYSQRAIFTQNSTDCRPILESARQYSDITLSGGLYKLYFDCVVDGVGITDPSVCDVAPDKINYPYCIIKVAVKAQDPTLCVLAKSEADTANYYYNQCTREVNS